MDRLDYANNLFSFIRDLIQQGGNVQYNRDQGFEPEGIFLTIQHENISLCASNPVQPIRDCHQQIQIRIKTSHIRKGDTYECEESTEELKRIDRC